MSNVDRYLSDITPRAASVTLLLFERVVARYEREKGRPLEERDRAAILTILRSIAAREA